MESLPQWHPSYMKYVPKDDATALIISAFQQAETVILQAYFNAYIYGQGDNRFDEVNELYRRFREIEARLNGTLSENCVDEITTAG